MCPRWTRHYPKLLAQKPSEDICGECFVFWNQDKYVSNQLGNNDNNNNNSNDANAENKEDDKIHRCTRSLDDKDNKVATAMMLAQKTIVLKSTEDGIAVSKQQQLFQ